MCIEKACESGDRRPSLSWLRLLIQKNIDGLHIIEVKTADNAEVFTTPMSTY